MSRNQPLGRDCSEFPYLKAASTLRFVLLPAAVGAVVAIVCAAVWLLLERDVSVYRAVESGFAIVQTLVWPTSVFMIGAAGGGSLYWELLLISTLANAILYGLLGYLIWIGVNKHGAALFAAILILLVLWGILLPL